MLTSNIKINCLGASNTRIIRGENLEKINDINYPLILGLLKRCEVRNYGVSCTTIARCPGRTDSYVERMHSMDRNANVVIFQGEGNDASKGLPLGTPGEQRENTFCGATRAVIEFVQKEYPEAKLIVLSGMNKKNPPKREDGLTHADFHAAFLETCRLCGVEAYDFWKDELIQPVNPDMMPDGIHMSEKACRRYAEIVAGLI